MNDIVKIINPKQATFYMLQGVIPVKVRYSEYEDSKDTIIYEFNKEESQHVFNLWKIANSHKH